MRVYNDKVLIHIDKKLQVAKRQKTASGIYISPAYQYMQYNLQHGQVLQVGEKVKSVLPEIETGDIAIFHHVVEEKPNTLVKMMPNMDEIRVLYVSEHDMLNQLYATIKPDGTIIPAKHYVLLHTMGALLAKKVTSSILQLTEQFDSAEYYQGIIDNNKKTIQQLNNTLASVTDNTINRNDISKRMHELYLENQQLTQKIQGPKMASFKVMAAAPSTEKELQIRADSKIVTRHELLIPLSIMDVQMMLCYKKYISMVLDN